MNGICLPEVFVADITGLILMVGCFIGTLWRFQKKNKEHLYLLGMFITTALSCLADMGAFYFDGKSGFASKVILYITNYALFISNMAIGALWVSEVARHVNGKKTMALRICIIILSVIGSIALIVNSFYPLVFSIDSENRYHRGPLFLLYSLIETFYIIDAMAIYFIGISKGGVLTFFPVLQFFIPIIIGFLAQSFFYGISTIWLGLSVGISTMVIATQNENIVIDKLTGMFNRYYFDIVRKKLGKVKRSTYYGVMMLDMNSFKVINDKFGHTEGDLALVEMASILKNTIMNKGIVIRYAGDEFVVLINTGNQETVDYYAALIKENTEKYNKTSGKDYKLSVSIGHGIFNLKETSLDTIMKIVDNKMYEDKALFYTSTIEHDRRK